MMAIYAFIDKHYSQKITLSEIAAVSHLSKEAFCRYFKKATTYTFKEFLNRYRVSQAKTLLISGHSISNACFQPDLKVFRISAEFLSK